MTDDENLDPIDIIELAQDILKASHSHIMGVDLDVLACALVHAAGDIVVAARACSRAEAAEYLHRVVNANQAMDERIERGEEG